MYRSIIFALLGLLAILNVADSAPVRSTSTVREFSMPDYGTGNLLHVASTATKNAHDNATIASGAEGSAQDDSQKLDSNFLTAEGQYRGPEGSTTMG